MLLALFNCVINALCTAREREREREREVRCLDFCNILILIFSDRTESLDKMWTLLTFNLRKCSIWSLFFKFISLFYCSILSPRVVSTLQFSLLPFRFARYNKVARKKILNESVKRNSLHSVSLSSKLRFDRILSSFLCLNVPIMRLEKRFHLY